MRTGQGRRPGALGRSQVGTSLEQQAHDQQVPSGAGLDDGRLLPAGGVRLDVRAGAGL